jgi:hypothetical protein
LTGTYALTDDIPGLSPQTFEDEIAALTGRALASTVTVTGIKYNSQNALTDFIYGNGNYDVTYADGSYTVAAA